MHAALLPRFLFAALPALAATLIISAPETCGGTHVVTHATAFFGPKPGTSDVRDVSLFAPRAQAEGTYLRAVVALAPPHLYVNRRPEGRGARAGVRSPMRPLSALLRAVVSLSSPASFLRRRRERLFGGAAVLGIERPGKGAHGVAEGATVVWHQEASEGDEPRRGDSAADPPALERNLDRVREGNSIHVRSPIAHANGAHLLNEGAGKRRIGDGDDNGVHGRITRATDEEKEVDGEAGREGTDGEASSFSLFNACRQLSVPHDMQQVKGRVAVVARGVCDFAQKVGFMQDAGAVGVIVVNFKDGGEQLANMKLNDTKENPAPIAIPAVMISYKDWSEVMPCRNDTKVVFTAEGEATFDIDYGRDALNWAMMRGMALWILCQCGVNVVRYKRRVSEFRARADAIAALPVETYERQPSPVEDVSVATEEESRGDSSPKEPVPAPSVAGPAPSSPIMDHDPERVGLISPDTESTVRRSSGGAAASSASTAVEDDDEIHEEEPVCAVCLEEFENGQQVRLLACSHLYHRACIDPWLQSSSNCCPLCKREVPNLPPPPTTLHYGSMSV